MDALDGQRRSASFSWSSLLEQHRVEGRPYMEFIRTPALSTGLYVLPAGGVDAQLPHTEDEVYIVVAGGSLFTAGAETREVRAGDVLYVAAGVPHRFHDISEALRAIVVFAPPERSAESAGSGADGSAGSAGPGASAGSEADGSARAGSEV